jgi:EAL domain-containing protein (putative c-di-GMP-specific phosphodiesterase class I)
LAQKPNERNALREERDRFLAFAFASADALIEIDPSGRILYATGALYRFSNSSDVATGEGAGLEGRSFLDFVAPHYRQRVQSALSGLSKRNRFGPLPVDFTPEGALPLRADVNAARLPDSGNLYLTIRFSGPRRRPLAMPTEGFAEVTGLTPKQAFNDLAAHALRASYQQPQPFNLSFIELKGLDDLTGRLEERVADGLLRNIGEDLKAYSLKGETAGHIDGNRFGLVHEAARDITKLEEDISGRTKAIDPMGAGVDVLSGTMPLTGNPDQHRENARALLYAINKFSQENDDFTLEDMSKGSQTTIAATVQRIGDLRSTIEGNLFDIVYQPVVYLEGRATHHYEALVRFHGDESGSPFDQIVFAEHVGLIARFDLAMCHRVIAKIRQAEQNGHNLHIAVNVSGRSLETPAFLGKLETLLDKYPNLPGKLMFEITESAKIVNLEATANFLNKLRGKGYQVCLDDFGAGASAFHYLRALEVDYVKIDGSYVRDALTQPEILPFLRSITGLCNELSVETIGEQIEDEGTAGLLQSLGVRLGQGYLLGPPNAGLAGLNRRTAGRPRKSSVGS